MPKQPTITKIVSATVPVEPQRAADRPRVHGLLHWLIALADKRESEPWYSAYVSVALALVVAVAVRSLLAPLFGGSAPYGIFLVAVMYIAWSRGLVPSLVTIALGIPIATYLFVEPRYSFAIDDLGNLASLVMSLVLGISVSLFSESLRVAAAENKRLYEIARQNEIRKDEFLAMLAHELRNPLAPISNALYVLDHLASPDPEVAACRDLIGRQVDYLIRLVEDLLEVSRITRGIVDLRIERTPLAEIVSGAVEISRTAIADKRQDLKVTTPAEPLFVNVDRIRITQVLANLLNNASRYTEQAGQIWFTAERAGDGVVLRVRDTGIGIAQENLERVFDLFEQIDPHGQYTPGGLGIGLTLVRRLVQLHGGKVAAHSPGPGLGSEFAVELPGVLAEAPQPAKPTDGADDFGHTEKPRRVLVVDDNVASALSMAKVLGLWNHEVQVCHDGFSALEMARAFQPEVVLADIGLPRMNGYQLASQLRIIPGLEHVLLVAVTGFGMQQDLDRADAAGFDRHLLKPVNPDELSQVLSLAHSG